MVQFGQITHFFTYPFHLCVAEEVTSFYFLCPFNFYFFFKVRLPHYECAEKLLETTITQMKQQHWPDNPKIIPIKAGQMHEEALKSIFSFKKSSDSSYALFLWKSAKLSPLIRNYSLCLCKPQCNKLHAKKLIYTYNTYAGTIST